MMLNEEGVILANSKIVFVLASSTTRTTSLLYE